jgi:hypothetical protein
VGDALVRQGANVRNQDEFDQLDQLAPFIEGGTLTGFTTTTEQATATITARDGGVWRIAFADGEGYRLPAYEPISDNQELIGAHILGACWDDSWLIEANVGDEPVHIRMFGRLISIERSTL